MNLKSAMLTAALLVAIAFPALAQSFADGQALYDKNDMEGARAIWQPLADANDPNAQFYIAQMHELGAGGLKTDYKKAYMWYTIASTNGNYVAGDARELSKSMLSPSDIEAANTMAQDWLTAHPAK